MLLFYLMNLLGITAKCCLGNWDGPLDWWIYTTRMV
uniref:Uncharacterized protein n=1 Tax=Rhizophora mucronata TaxID=61149 RepID=A0A2P2PTE0_RHIMU